MKTLETIGYGNNMPPAFLERLIASETNLLFDIRRAGCSSWHGHYRWGKLGAWLYKNHWQGLYRTIPALSRPDDMPMPDFIQWLETSEARDALLGVIDTITEFSPFFKPALMCSCLKVRSGGEGNYKACHRLYVAEKLVEIMGADWRVEHL